MPTLHHIALKVHDLLSTATFYERIMGLKEIDRKYLPDETLRSIWLKMDDGTILMIEKGDQLTGSGESNGWHLLAFEMTASEREEKKNFLQTHGVVIEMESDFSLYFRDPEGNRLAFTHYPAS